MREQALTFSGILLLANRIQTTLDQALPELTLKQWLCLVIIASEGKVDSMAEVVDKLGTSHQNAAKLVRALEAKGFVEFGPSSDKRARSVALTDHAREYLRANNDRGDGILTQLFDGIDPADTAACLRVLNALSLNLGCSSIYPEGES
ncbi:MarR family protein [Corynebacterium kalinowskii]|uniref:MarR family protein n=1 Tax=Corynebacterium kalinowskii TaxID=2675216 RepID=A0A6B8VA29_9CORY|nr:MarR family transcriptional regulator [Corynebacterium kalinowskii]QGU01982.1 MarR family protein [Corynebacterium kalinowskii]